MKDAQDKKYEPSKFERSETPRKLHLSKFVIDMMEYLKEVQEGKHKRKGALDELLEKGADRPPASVKDHFPYEDSTELIRALRRRGHPDT